MKSKASTWISASLIFATAACERASTTTEPPKSASELASADKTAKAIDAREILSGLASCPVTRAKREEWSDPLRVFVEMTVLEIPEANVRRENDAAATALRQNDIRAVDVQSFHLLATDGKLASIEPDKDDGGGTRLDVNPTILPQPSDVKLDVSLYGLSQSPLKANVTVAEGQVVVLPLGPSSPPFQRIAALAVHIIHAQSELGSMLACKLRQRQRAIDGRTPL
jgi:hypothetical protein